MTASTIVTDRAIGCLLGLAAGDALGTTLEFGPRRALGNFHTEMTGGGPFRLEPGQWTDDMSQALALAYSLRANRGVLNPTDLLERFSAWYRDGEYSSNGRCFDIGNQTRQALHDYARTGSLTNGTEAHKQGNGGIMRLAPAAIVARSVKQAVELSMAQSATTHNSPIAMTAASSLGAILYSLINEGPGDELSVWRRLGQMPRDKISSTGHCGATLNAALWAVGRTDNFRDAVVEAVNLGDDADTVGAVAGQIAGALYGLAGIPTDWVELLTNSQDIRVLASDLINL